MNTALTPLTCNLNDCLAGLVPESLPQDVEISGMKLDSRQIHKGDLFVACSGVQVDGRDFARDAQERGAAAVLSEQAIEDLEIPNLVVSELKNKLGPIADRFYDKPSAYLNMVGVTGTNGKTSVAYYISTLLQLLGKSSGYLGTVGWGIPPDLQDSLLTTEDVLTLHRRLAVFRQNHVTNVCMEVSSHALNQNRVDAIDFDIAVFTNLSRDHLDYHKSMENYASAKRKLFFMGSIRCIVVNIDDAVGRDIFTSVNQDIRKISFGRDSDADISWKALKFSTGSISGTLQVFGQQHAFCLPLYGEFNVENFCASLGVLIAMGISTDSVLKVSAHLKPVPGRMQYIKPRGGCAAIIDFAHTPDALEKALAAARLHVDGRLLCVFGCGGDRDPGKRAQMARIAETGCDLVWVTNDNPRTESPEKIVAEIMLGFEQAEQINVELDRRCAIEAAIREAKFGDVVFIAGKGHETYQEIQGERQTFSDVAIVQQAMGVMV